MTDFQRILAKLIFHIKHNLLTRNETSKRIQNEVIRLEDTGFTQIFHNNFLL